MTRPLRNQGLGGLRAGAYFCCLWWSGAALAQDMVGPSTSSFEPLEQPVEMPETLGEDEFYADDPDTDVAGDLEGEAPAIPGQHEEAFVYQKEWESLISAARFDEAVELAKVWHNDAVIQFGEISAAAVAPLRHLGDAYQAMERPGLAARAYKDAIKSAERSIGVFDPQLIESLTRLGGVYQKQGDDEAAVSMLMRAKDITHRNQGIYNLEQGPIVDQLTESYVGLGEIRQATREQKFLFGTAAKNLQEDHPEMVPALQKWAKWNARIGRYPDARRHFNDAVEILEQAYGPNDLRIVETLNMIAKSFYDNKHTTHPREGLMALRRAVEIYQAQEFVDQADLLRAQSRVADWHMFAERRERGIRTYAKAIAEARASGLDSDSIDAVYGLPRMLGAQHRDVPLGLSSRQLEEVGDGPHRVVFEFDLDKSGRARNVRLIEDTLSIISTAKLLRFRLNNSVFRPRFVEGVPLPTYGMRLQFNVYPESDVAEPGNPLYNVAGQDDSETG